MAFAPPTAIPTATHKMPFRHVACAWLSGIYELTKPHWGRVESYVGGNQRFLSSRSTTNEKSAVVIHACSVSANHKAIDSLFFGVGKFFMCRILNI